MLRPKATTMLIAVVLLAGSGTGSPAPTDAASRRAETEAAASCSEPLTRANRPVAPAGASDDPATFIDPTAVVRGASNVRVSERGYIAPFATLIARSAAERNYIEEGSNIQDNTLLVTNRGHVRVGESAIVAQRTRR